jgi:high-affinity nickel-transport protein
MKSSVGSAAVLQPFRASTPMLWGLLAFNGAAWVAAWVLFQGHPLLLGSCGLAYGFGLRHAVDADHIAAIDNATRKLLQEGQSTAGVGLFFSLGHSSLVLLLTLALALTASSFGEALQGFCERYALVGTAASVVILLSLAGINLMIARDAWRHESHHRGGLLSRLCAPVFRLVDRSWKMAIVGVLFGLGFETASEVGVLGLSAIQASQGLPIWSIMVFPLLFTAAMSLVDTGDGLLMAGVYSWANRGPFSKRVYNLSLTLISVLVAVVVAVIEVAGVIDEHLHPPGQVWRLAGWLWSEASGLGIGLILVFVLAWASALGLGWLRSRAARRHRKALERKGF